MKGGFLILKGTDPWKASVGSAFSSSGSWPASSPRRWWARNHGLLTNLVVGVVGAYVGAFIFSLLGLQAGGLIGALVVATIGAIALLALVGAIRVILTPRF